MDSSQSWIAQSLKRWPSRTGSTGWPPEAHAPLLLSFQRVNRLPSGSRRFADKRPRTFKERCRGLVDVGKACKVVNRSGKITRAPTGETLGVGGCELGFRFMPGIAQRLIDCDWLQT